LECAAAVVEVNASQRFVIPTGAGMGLSPTQGDEKRLGLATTLYEPLPFPIVIPSVTRVSYVPAVTSATHVVLFNENHMKRTEA
jgi:hypothetical protein